MRVKIDLVVWAWKKDHANNQPIKVATLESKKQIERLISEGWKDIRILPYGELHRAYKDSVVDKARNDVISAAKLLLFPPIEAASAHRDLNNLLGAARELSAIEHEQQA